MQKWTLLGAGALIAGLLVVLMVQAGKDPTDPSTAEMAVEATSAQRPEQEPATREIRLPLMSTVERGIGGSDAEPQATRTERARRDREEAETRLQNSGPLDAPWTRKATLIMEDALRAVQGEEAPSMQSTEIKCYAEGCVAHLSFASMGQYDDAHEALLDSPIVGEFAAIITGPEQVGAGRVENAVFLLRPPTDAERELAEQRRQARMRLRN